MKGFGAISVGNVGWLEKEMPVAGPLDAICRPIAVAPYDAGLVVAPYLG